MGSDQDIFSIEDSQQPFEEFFDAVIARSQDQETLRTAKVLLLPEEGFRSHGSHVFHRNTEEVLSYFRAKLGSDIYAAIPVDQEATFIELRDDLIQLGIILLKDIGPDIVAGVISALIFERLSRKGKSDRVEMDLVLDNDGKVRKVKYRGGGTPADMEKLAQKIAQANGVGKKKGSKSR